MANVCPVIALQCVVMPTVATHLLLKMWLNCVTHQDDCEWRQGRACCFDRGISPEEQVQTAVCLAGNDEYAASVSQHVPDLLGKDKKIRVARCANRSAQLGAAGRS